MLQGWHGIAERFPETDAFSWMDYIIYSLPEKNKMEKVTLDGIAGFFIVFFDGRQRIGRLPAFFPTGLGYHE